MIYIKSKAEIEKMREAGRIVAKAHDAVSKYIRIGVTTWELDKIVEDVIRTHGAIPSFKGYNGFPAASCISVNNEIIHGIPSKLHKLQDGDIAGVDIGALLFGYHGDSAATYGVGNISSEAQRLITVTQDSFYAACSVAKDRARLSEISQAVQETAESAGFSVVREFVGHGVGKALHESPEVPNFYSERRPDVKLQSGMTIAVEPMINQGTREIRQLSDGWTVVTADGKLSAHYEHTVAITDGAPILLTKL